MIFNLFDRICCLGILLLVFLFFSSLDSFNSNSPVSLHTDVYLVGLLRDVEIEQYLDLEMQLKRKLGNHNSCILSNDRHAASPGTNFPSSLFDCRANME